MSCKLSDKCDNIFACNVLRPNVKLLGCNFYKPKKPQTNEEWRKTCSAEEFAEWITDKINAKLRMALHDAELYPDDINENEYMENEDEWVKWLKEKHDGNT